MQNPVRNYYHDLHGDVDPGHELLPPVALSLIVISSSETLPFLIACAFKGHPDKLWKYEYANVWNILFHIKLKFLFTTYYLNVCLPINDIITCSPFVESNNIYKNKSKMPWKDVKCFVCFFSNKNTNSYCWYHLINVIKLFLFCIHVSAFL